MRHRHAGRRPTGVRPPDLPLPPAPRPPRRRLAQALVFLGVSIALHAGIAVLVRRAPRPEAEAPPPLPVALQIVERPPAPRPPAPPAQPARQAPAAPARASAARPRPSPSLPTPPDAPVYVPPVAAAPGRGAPEPAVPAAPSGAEPADDAGAAPTAPSNVRLFDPAALAGVARRAARTDPAASDFVAPRSGPGGDGLVAEQARVEKRLGQMVAQAAAIGEGHTGLATGCNDGMDNNYDGLFDCADPGCRRLPACRNTADYTRWVAREIPDEDPSGLASEMSLTGPGVVRALSVRVQLQHGSPGDLALELENPTLGRTVTLRLADRTENAYERGFYLRDFNGQPAAGRWRLHVRDVVPGTAGKLESWTLYVTRDR